MLEPRGPAAPPSRHPGYGGSRWWRQASFGPVTSPSGVSMRVLILSWEYPPIVEGGLARHVRKLAEGLVRERRRGARARARRRAPRGGRGPPRRDRPPRARAGVPEGRPRRLRRLGRRHERRHARGRRRARRLASFDLVHSHDWLVAGAARKLARRFKCPWLVTVHATEHGRHQGWVKKHPQTPHPRRRAADGAGARTASSPARTTCAATSPRCSGSTRRRSPWCPTGSTPRTSSRSRTCRGLRARYARRTSSSCCWSGGSSTRRASTSRSTRCRA